MFATAASLAALVTVGAFAATSPPTPDPDPSVKPGTRITWVSYTVELPVFTADGHRVRGWKWSCVYRPHRSRVCSKVRG